MYNSKLLYKKFSEFYQTSASLLSAYRKYAYFLEEKIKELLYDRNCLLKENENLFNENKKIKEYYKKIKLENKSLKRENQVLKTLLKELVNEIEKIEKNQKIKVIEKIIEKPVEKIIEKPVEKIVEKPVEKCSKFHDEIVKLLKKNNLNIKA